MLALLQELGAQVDPRARNVPLKPESLGPKGSGEARAFLIDGVQFPLVAIAEYLAALRANFKEGDCTEHTHRPPLKAMLEAAGGDIVATNEPGRTLCGAPDFIITRNKTPLGHVETKDIGVNLDEMERGKGPNGDQFLRYNSALANWILTDYLEFRWFVGGEKRLTVRLAELDAKQKLKPTPDGEAKLAQLLDSFFKQPALTIGTAQELARRMAGMTRNVRDLIIGAFQHEQEKGWLHNWLTAFRETLIPDLDEPQFADMFAQTIAYGLFAAAIHAPSSEAFTRKSAAWAIPKTNPFLRKLFSEVAGPDMPTSIDWAVDDTPTCPPSSKTLAKARARKTPSSTSTKPSSALTTVGCANCAASSTRRSRL